MPTSEASALHGSPPVEHSRAHHCVSPTPCAGWHGRRRRWARVGTCPHARSCQCPDDGLRARSRVIPASSISAARRGQPCVTAAASHRACVLRAAVAGMHGWHPAVAVRGLGRCRGDRVAGRPSTRDDRSPHRNDGGNAGWPRSDDGEAPSSYRRDGDGDSARAAAERSRSRSSSTPVACGNRNDGNNRYDHNRGDRSNRSNARAHGACPNRC